MKQYHNKKGLDFFENGQSSDNVQSNTPPQRENSRSAPSQGGGDDGLAIDSVKRSEMPYSVFNISDIITLMRHNTLLLTVFPIIVIVSALIYLHSTPSIYQAKSLVQIKEKSGSTSPLAGIMGMSGGGGGKKSSAALGTEFAFMRSKVVASALLEKMADDDPALVHGLNPASIGQLVRITQISGTSLYNIKVEHTDPRQAAFIVNNLITSYLDHRATRNAKETKSASHWLDERMISVKKSIKAGETKLRGIRKKRGVDLSSDITRDPLVNEVAGYATLINRNEMKLLHLRSSHKKLAQFIKNKKFTDAAKRGLGGRQAQAAAEKLLIMFEKMAELKKIYLPKHPAVVKNQALYRQQKLLLQKKLEGALVLNGEKIASIELESSTVGKKIVRIRATLNDPSVINVRRQLYLDQKMYDGMIGKRSEVEMMSAMEKFTVSILEKSSIPKTPIRPQRAKIVALSVVIGIVGAIAIVILLDFLSPTILSEVQLEAYCGISVIKSIGQMKITDETSLNGSVFLFKKPGVPMAEVFRYIRTSLDYTINENNRVFMVCSADANDGKSFVSLNLAAAMALGGRRTLLCEFDMRKPSLSRTFQNMDIVGLYGYFQGGNSIDECIANTQFNNLDFLLSGRLLSNPIDVVGSRRFENLIQELRERYEVIIVDTPKILGLADSLIVSRYVDSMLVVASGGKPLSAFMHAIKLMSGAREKIRGIILNRSFSSKHDYYYYRYEFNEEDQKKFSPAIPDKVPREQRQEEQVEDEGSHIEEFDKAFEEFADDGIKIISDDDSDPFSDDDLAS